MSEPFRDPPWQGPAEHVMAAPVALSRPFGRREDGAVAWLSRFAACPDGVVLTVTVAAQDDPEPLGRPGDEGSLRVGVRFADGREATFDFDPGRWPETGGRPAEEIALLALNSNGSSQRYDQDVWLWPLPPEGDVTFTSSWGGEVVVDGAALRAAAEEAVELWPDERPYWPEDEEDEEDDEDEDGEGWSSYAPSDAGGDGLGPRQAPGAVGASLVLVRTDAVAVWLSGLEATPETLDFQVNVAWQRRLDPREDEGPFGRDLPFVLHVELPDGSVARAGDDGWFEGEGREPGPMLSVGGGDGWDRGMRRRAALRPLPGEGTLRFVLSWPQEGVEEAVAELDGALVRAAAERAVVLWPEDPAGE